jgi:hypothetical protein
VRPSCLLPISAGARESPNETALCASMHTEDTVGVSPEATTHRGAKSYARSPPKSKQMLNFQTTTCICRQLLATGNNFWSAPMHTAYEDLQMPCNAATSLFQDCPTSELSVKSGIKHASLAHSLRNKDQRYAHKSTSPPDCLLPASASRDHLMRPDRGVLQCWLTGHRM